MSRVGGGVSDEFPTHVGVNRYSKANVRQLCEFPTHVGVNRISGCAAIRDARIPHARGGEPPLACVCAPTPTNSPRTWG